VNSKTSVLKSYLNIKDTTTTPDPTTAEVSTTTTRIDITRTTPNYENETTTTHNDISTPVPDNAEVCAYYLHDEFGYICELRNIYYDHMNTSFPITGRHLDGKSDSDVSAVIFTDSKLTKIPSEIARKFELIETLIAKQTGIDRVDEKTLENCGTLKHIDLSENKISALADEAFETCANLTSVKLSNNLLSSLPAKVFHQNLNLESIILDSNKIASIDPCNNAIRYQLKKLQLLSLNKNVCVSNSYHHQDLHSLFDELVLGEIKICYGYWFL